MKKIFYILASAIVALGAVACENDGLDNIGLEVNGDTVSFIASIDNNRTALDGVKTIWDEDDTIVVNWNGDDYEFKNSADEPNKFSCSADGLSAIRDAEKITATYSHNGDGNIDSTADTAGALLTYDEGPLANIKFAVQNAFLKFTAEEDAEVTLTATADIFSTGKVLTLTATGKEQYVAVNPTTAEIAFSYSINDVKYKSKTATFAAKNIYNLGDLSAPVVKDGNYFVVAKKDGYYWGMKNDNTEKFRVADQTTVSEYTDYKSFPFTADHVWTISKVEGEETYTIANKDAKYLAAKSGENQALLSTTAEKVTISYDSDNGFYTILTTSELDETRILRFNTNSGQERFAFYKKSVKENVANIELIPVPADAVFKSEITMTFTDVTITEGETFTAPEPTFSTTPEGNYTVTYEVTEGTIASVVDGKVVCDGKTAGTATIKATFTGDNYYDTTDTYTITVNEKQEAGAPVYEKVTSAPADWSGKYLIVWGTGAHATVSGSDLAKTADVTISNNQIASSTTVDKAAVVVTKTTDNNYSVKLPNGNYLSLHNNGNKVAASTSAFNIYFTYTTNGVKILGKDNSSNERVVAKNDSYYRAYKTSASTTSSYALPTLYKYTGGSEGGETPEPEQPETPAVVAPTITVDNQEVPAEGATNATADVDLGSPAGDWTYTVTDDADWLTATWTTNAVTYTAEANTVAEKRSATVTITAKLSGQTDVTEEFTITQAAAEVVEPEQPGGGDVETKISTLTVETINAVKEMGNGSYGNYKDTDVTITVEGVTYVAKNICATAKNTPNGFAAKTFIQIKNGNYIYNTTAVKSVKIWSNGETYNVNGGSSKNPTTKLTASNSSKENVDVKDNNGNSKTASLFVKEFDITGGYFKINTTAATYIYKVEVTY